MCGCKIWLNESTTFFCGVCLSCAVPNWPRRQTTWHIQHNSSVLIQVNRRLLLSPGIELDALVNVYRRGFDHDPYHSVSSIAP